MRALARDAADRAPFGAPAPAEELPAALDRLPDRRGPHGGRGAVCFAHGWRLDDVGRGGRRRRLILDVVCRVSPVTP